MKRNKSMAIGLVCAMASMACVGLYVWQVDSQAEAYRAEALERYGGDQIEVCVATRDIAAGETILDSALERRTWVVALLPEGFVADPSEVTGKTAGSSILKGEVLTAKRLDSAASALEVPEGLAAISVPARDVQAIGGALAPGMRADVYAIGPSSTSKLLSDTLIVATSASASELSASSAVAWVTLAVQPSEVEQVIAAAENLELYFVLPHAQVSPEALAAASDDGGEEDGAAVTQRPPVSPRDAE